MIRAPIPLISKLKPESETGAEITIKFRRDPADARSDTFTKKVREFTGDSAEGYVQWRILLEDCAKQIPLNTIQQQLDQAENLLGRPAKETFRTIRAMIITNNAANTQANFKRVMDEFALTFIPAGAPYLQKLYMRRECFQPKSMTIAEFSNRLKVLNNSIRYLPGQNNTPIPEDEFQELFIHGLNEAYRNIMKLTNHVWHQHTHSQNLTYLQSLEGIKDELLRNFMFASKPTVFKKQTNYKGKKWCTECQSPTHNNVDCRILKRKKNKNDSDDEKKPPAKKNAPGFKNNKPKKQAEYHHMETIDQNEDDDENVINDEMNVEVEPNEEDEPQQTNHNGDEPSDDEDTILNKLFNSEISENAYLSDLFTTAAMQSDKSTSNTYTTAVSATITTEEGEIIKLNVLLDTGSSKTLIKRKALSNAFFETHKLNKSTQWRTNTGTFNTKYEIPLTFTIPAFAPRKEITWKAQIDETEMNLHGFDLIIGRDLLQALRMDIRFSTNRYKHTYKLNDLVLKERDVIQPKLHRPRDGPFTITKLFSNGTARISNGTVAEIVSFRRLLPYKSAGPSGGRMPYDVARRR